MKSSYDNQELMQLGQLVRVYLIMEEAIHEADGEILGCRTVADICATCNFSQAWWEDVKITMFDLGFPLVGSSRGYYLGQPGECVLYYRYLARQLTTRTASILRTLERWESSGLLKLAHVYSVEKLGTKMGAALEQIREWDEDDRIRRLLSNGEKQPA